MNELFRTIWLAFQVSIFIIKFKTEIHMFYTGYAIMKDEVQNTKCIYSLQRKPLTRQGNEDKIRYFYIKGGTSWSSCNYGIN